MVELHIERGARGLSALLSRALALDAQASARMQEVGAGQLDVFVTTPFDAIASRRTSGTTTDPGATVSARDLLDALQSEEVCACDWQKNDPTKNIDKMAVVQESLK